MNTTKMKSTCFMSVGRKAEQLSQAIRVLALREQNDGEKRHGYSASDQIRGQVTANCCRVSARESEAVRPGSVELQRPDDSCRPDTAWKSNKWFTYI